MTIKERKEEIDLMLAQVIKDIERKQRLPIENKILNPFYL